MTKWNTLRSRLPEDEFDEIERIKEKYDLSYNEIICSGVKIYVGLTLAKEIIASALEDKDIQVKGKTREKFSTAKTIRQIWIKKYQ